MLSNNISNVHNIVAVALNKLVIIRFSVDGCITFAKETSYKLVSGYVWYTIKVSRLALCIEPFLSECTRLMLWCPFVQSLIKTQLLVDCDKRGMRKKHIPKSVIQNILQFTHIAYSVDLLKQTKTFSNKYYSSKPMLNYGMNKYSSAISPYTHVQLCHLVHGQFE